MIAQERKIIRQVLQEEEFPHWLFDRSVVKSSLGRVHVCGDWVLFYYPNGTLSVASKDEVKQYVAKVIYARMRTCTGKKGVYL